MSISDDKWFEIWFSQGIDIMPACLYVVIPDRKRQGYVVVIDPRKNNEVVFEGKNYEETETWLLEDEFLLVRGREFPDDGW